MKKLLILGATINQLSLIKAARDAGLYVIVCDWTTTNPGIAFANKHYQVSTMDLDAVMKVAIDEKIDGCVTNSEPALMNATLVAERLGLPGNPSAAIDILTSKTGFRDLQERTGLFAPKHYVCDSVESLIENARNINGPFVIKPVRSSGSRGTTLVEKYNECVLRHAYTVCTEFSRDNLCSVEEYVRMPTLQVLDGDVFLYDGKILWDGLFCSVRSRFAPMVPTSQIYPLQLEESKMNQLKGAISSVLIGSGARTGEFNIEAYFTESGKLFIIEINPRQGGNKIPEQIKEHCGIDMARLLVTTAVGDRSYWDCVLRSERKYLPITLHPVYAHSDGVFKALTISPELKEYVDHVEFEARFGDKVEKCCNASGILAYVRLKFPSVAVQQKHSLCLEDLIIPEITDRI